MTLITLDEQISKTASLLRSLEESLCNLRQRAEDLAKRIETGEDVNLADGSRQVGKVNDLIRSCQKVEEHFVEHHNKQAGIARGGYALDLEEARSEIGCRLARLRACSGA